MSAKISRPSGLAALRDRLMAIDPPPQVRRWLRTAGYPAFAVLVALITFAAALPDDKVKDRLETLLSQDPTSTQPLGLGADIKAGELSLSLLRRGIRADNVVLRTRPIRSTDRPSRYVLDVVKVNVGLLGLIFQRPTYAFTIEAFRGLIEGSARVTMTDNHYRIEASDIDLASIQGLQTLLGPPLEGKLEGKGELDAPGRLLGNSSGSIEVTIDGTSFGDGKGKLTIPGDPFLAQGVTIPKIRLGKISATITIEKGKAHIDSFVAHSADGDVTLEGYIDLRDPFPSSSLHLFLRFKISEALLKREATLELITGTLNANGKRTDGFIGAQITGSFASAYFQANKNPPPGVSSKHEPGAAPAGGPPPGGMAPAPVAAPPGAAPAAAVDAAQAPAEPPPPPKETMIPPPPTLRPASRELPHVEEAAPAAAPPAPAPAEQP